jgi:hypothetical protein
MQAALVRLARSAALPRSLSPLSSVRVLGLSCTRRQASFQGVGGGPTGGSGSSPAAAWEASYLKHFGNNHTALNTWMATYYRQATVPMETEEEVEMAAKVHGERIVGALFASLQVRDPAPTGGNKGGRGCAKPQSHAAPCA